MFHNNRSKCPSTTCQNYLSIQHTSKTYFAPRSNRNKCSSNTRQKCICPSNTRQIINFQATTNNRLILSIQHTSKINLAHRSNINNWLCPSSAHQKIILLFEATGTKCPSNTRQKCICRSDNFCPSSTRQKIPFQSTAYKQLTLSIQH
jgi:hypothetical protein